MAPRPECANGARWPGVGRAARALAQGLIQLESDRQRPASSKQDEFISRGSKLKFGRRRGRTFKSESTDTWSCERAPPAWEPKLSRTSLAWVSLVLLVEAAQLLMANNQHKLQIAIPLSPSSSLTAAAHEPHRTHSSVLSSGRHHHKSTHGQLHSNQTDARQEPAGVWQSAGDIHLNETLTPTGQWPATACRHRRRRRWRRQLERGADIGARTRRGGHTPAPRNEQEFRLANKPIEQPDEDDQIEHYQDRWRALKLAAAHHHQARRRLAPPTADIGNVFVSRGENYAIISASRRRQLRASEGLQNKLEPAAASIKRDFQEIAPTHSAGFVRSGPLAANQFAKVNTTTATATATTTQIGHSNSIGGATASPPPGSPTGAHSEPTNDASDENDDPTDDRDDNWTESSSSIPMSSPASTGYTGDTGDTCDSIEGILATRPSRATGWVFGFNYSIIFVFGLLGNVITLYVLLCKGKKCSAQDILIANLACSDIMLCVFAVPITPKYLILDGHWTLGPALCKVVSFAQSTSVYMSTYSLICIGYIRYRLIVHPLEETMSKRTALFSCLGTWGVSLLVTLPYTLQVRLSPENCDIKFCDEAWEKPYLRFVFSLFTTFFQFIIPLGSVGFFNKKIYSRLDGRRLGGGGGQQADHKSGVAPAADPAGSNSHAGGGGGGGGGCKSGLKFAASSEPVVGTPAQRPSHAHALAGIRDVLAIKEQRQRDKENRMRKANNRLIFVVVIFAHSWLPLNLFNLAQDYFDVMSNWPYLTFTFLIVHQVACSSVCWNPILYAWMSETYRQDLRIALPKFIASRLLTCLSEPATSLHSTAGTHHSHHQATNTAANASHLAHSHHSLVHVNLSAGSTSGATFGFAATKALSANSSLAQVSLQAAPIGRSQTSGAASCDELCELQSGTAASSSFCGPCALEVPSDSTFADDQHLCCCQLAARLQPASHGAAHEDEQHERSQSSSGACRPLTNGTGRAYGQAAGGVKLAAIRRPSGDKVTSSPASADGPDCEQRRSSCCSMLSAAAASGATATSDAKSAQIVI